MPFSVKHTIATFHSQHIYLHVAQPPSCPAQLPKKTGPNTTEVTCTNSTVWPNGKKPPYQPSTELVLNRPASEQFEVFLYKTTSDVSRLRSGGFLRTTKDPLFRRRLN